MSRNKPGEKALYVVIQRPKYEYRQTSKFELMHFMATSAEDAISQYAPFAAKTEFGFCKPIARIVDIGSGYVRF